MNDRSTCLLFDCDGTLVDSERICSIAIAEKFREIGINLDAEELEFRFRGQELTTILEILKKEYGVLLPQNFVASYRSIVSELFESELRPIEGVEASLRQLTQPKAVVSNGPIQKVEQALRVCDLRQYFLSSIYSSHEINIWKPDPGIYLYAATDMGFRPNRCLVIEDSSTGVEAGSRAGMKTLFFNTYEENCVFPDVVSFDSMEELPTLIDGMQF